VHLVIAREGKKEPIHLTLTRQAIELNSVKGELLESNYAYIRISSFQTETAKTLDDLLAALAKQSSSGKLKGVILDLRNNPGGVLEAAIDVSDIFLDVNKVGYDKVIVTTKGRNAALNSVGKVTTPDHTQGVPVVVLINHGTASAAEIVAAALQDDNRAIVVGTRSFGKGSVQTIIPLLDGKTAVKLTTARYYTPKGTAIQAVGVTPDVVVDQAKVSEVTEENNFINSEDSLPGKLKAEQKKTPESLANQAVLEANNQESQKLVKKDFQLYQALMLLKGTVSLEQ
jgi:carboxyl-terminal processing protease